MTERKIVFKVEPGMDRRELEATTYQMRNFYRQFGPGSTIVNAFLFIGLDLTSRDKLHDAWGGNHLWLKMFTLIGTGSLLSWFLNRGAGQIALASFVAFAVAGMFDALVYHFMRDSKWLIRVNGSNVFSAMADSLIFPTIAFGSFLPLIVLGQFAAKVSGGFLWALLINRFRSRETTPALG
jgi:hypothetical protein